MEVFKEDSLGLDIGSSASSFQKFLDSQEELFHSQVDQLHSIVVTQCKLTGVNPLSQEMAAGALSINIGKRPRDLLNPKAVKYMQSVFSIKDAISKKESREISALFGVTVTQVRDFFTSQRSRVRKHVRLSREKAVRSTCKELQDGVSMSADSTLPLSQVPLNSAGTANDDEASACSTQDETPPGIDDLDKHFVTNIFNLMHKEETFSGQVKLMEWILRIENDSVLCWFLTKGGVMILATWLGQAAIEEQTSVLFVVLKVLCHLPLHKALPMHMSAILQSVNKLRFYRQSDISNRARVLLSRWSKIFARSQAMKRPNAMKSFADGARKVITINHSVGEILGDEQWQSKGDESGEMPASAYESFENFRKLESSQGLKVLSVPADDSNRKQIRSSPQTRERRKVMLVDQPAQKTAGRRDHITRAVPANQGRPLSVDDIQKAKLRALYQQSKNGKNSSPSTESGQLNIKGPNKSPLFRAGISPSKSPISSSDHNLRPKIEEYKRTVIVSSKIPSKLESRIDPKLRLNPKETLLEKCKRVQIHWKKPPEVTINGVWGVRAGEDSKEVEIQNNRNRREKEVTYNRVHDIPCNPKEPWDQEMDYDDSLTPDIPIEQPPDPDADRVDESKDNSSSLQIGSVTASVAEPDLELLAALLKNPDLVFALTSGQAGNLSSEETVQLLDAIKASNGVGLKEGSLNGLSGSIGKKIEVSLPSPTPSSNPTTSGWRPEFAKNPFSQQSPPTTAARDAYNFPAATATVIPPANTASTLLSPPMVTTNIPPPQAAATAAPFCQRVPPANSQTINQLPYLHHKPLNSTTIVHLPASGTSSTLPMVLNTPERTAIRFTTLPQSLPMQTRTPSYATGPNGKPGPVSDPWRERHHLGYQQIYRGGGSGFVSELPEFKTWNSQGRNLMRPPEFMVGRNFQAGPRMDLSPNYGPERSRDPNSSGFRENRRWHEQTR